ncbi:hypothetical protein N7495_000059 [Penicillium taxi]|uniref:uncharacterized protein n=1 Tax=Penicillium taxi TaxID=168475 RepID=UPI0025453C56|nr:uncharacterized protein N7495_000059 [Penicillium taxi]KAJ5907377.1 hypothetical protein N7495_000059 [Penicillium taxi]
MSPDINSLSPSPSSSSSSIPHRNNSSASPATTAVNPTSPRPSRGSSLGRLSISERHRLNAGMNLTLNEQAGAASGNNGAQARSDHRTSMGHTFHASSPTSHGGSPVFATADPHHQRAPSLGELHQELEQEQEAQVNRLLQMIRSQQAQLQQLQSQQQSASGTAILDDTITSSERSAFSPTHPPSTTPGNRLSISSLTHRPPSQAPSPRILPHDAHLGSESTEAFPALRDGSSRRGSRDESAFYQAEAAMLNRENQMLRQRIRELERQIGDMTTSSPAVETVGQERAEETDPPAVGSPDKD